LFHGTFRVAEKLHPAIWQQKPDSGGTAGVTDRLL
jgi:hypothetical protein